MSIPPPLNNSLTQSQGMGVDCVQINLGSSGPDMCYVTLSPGYSWFFFFSFYWTMLPYNVVSFYQTAMWISYTYAYILSFFVFPSDSGHHRTLRGAPCAVEYVIITVSFPHGAGVKILPATAGNIRDAGLIPALGISRDWTNVLIIYPFYESESASCSVTSDSLEPHGLYSPWNSSGQNTGVGNLSLLQGIFPTQGLNPGLPHCRWILCLLSYQESPM